jgi:hypothetical protein
MPIMTPKPPAGATEAFHGGLELFLAQPDLKRKHTHQADIGGAPKLPTLADLRQFAPAAPAPQHSFSLSLRSLKRLEGIAAAKRGSWRFYAGSGASDSIVGHTTQDSTTGAWKLTHVAYGARPAQLIAATRGLEQLAGLPPLDEFELRFLTIPGLLVEAFWLASLTGATDFAVIFPAPPDQLQRRLNAQAVYEMPVFMDIVSVLSAERLGFSARKG